MSRVTAPGYSVDLSDAARIALRRVRGLGGVTPIDFSSQKANAYRITLWYHHQRSTALVRALQLRREREGPYFHQFIVFELRDGGGLFRIDRRLRPDEGAPLNSLKDEGIPAFDTIEPVASWNDPLFPASDCLVSIKFKVDVHLALILKICRAIQAHPLAHVYTLQRYNCYFFAQTILLCIACGASNWAGTGDWLSEYKFNISQAERQLMKSTPNSNKGFLGLDRQIHKSTEHSKLRPKRPKSTPAAVEFPYLGYKISVHTTRNPPLCELRSRDIPNLYITHLWQDISMMSSLCDKIANSTQRVLKTHIEAEWAGELFTVYKDTIKRDIWEIPVRGCLVAFLSKLEEIVVETRIAEGSASYPPSSSSPTFSLYNLDSRWSNQAVHLQEFNELMLAYFESFGIRFSPIERLAELRKMLRSPPEAVDRKFTDTCLNSFKQNMVIQVNYGMVDIPQGTILNPNMEGIPRYRHARNTASPWRKTKQQQEQRMTTVTILEMQKYLVHLIHAHSVRVEQYKWATNAVAVDVARDIKASMNDIWKELIQSEY